MSWPKRDGDRIQDFAKQIEDIRAQAHKNMDERLNKAIEKMTEESNG